MQLGIDYGGEHLDLQVRGGSLVSVRRQPFAPPLDNPAAAVRAALEAPLGFPALRRALTPDDHVVIVVDEQAPHLTELMTPILEHIAEARIEPAAITLLCPRTAASQTWVDDLPDAFEEVRVEVHDPGDRKRLSYLATTRQGRRIYLNRTAVDADQLVILGRRGYDPLMGYSGAEGALYPALGDEEMIQEVTARLSLAVPGAEPWPTRQEASEVAWLLGAPFLIQVVEGAGDEISHVVCGLVDSAKEGQRLLDSRWRVTVEQPADLVVAGISGDPSRHGFAELAQALACASRVVKANGRIVLLTKAAPRLGRGGELLRQADDAGRSLQLLEHEKPTDMTAAFQWAKTAQQATIYLLSGLPDETAEELFTTPLAHAGQVQRLLDAAESCLLLPDAHKTLAVFAEE